MPLPSFFQKNVKAPKRAAVAEDTGPVQEARVRARRRLIGAVVLLAAGIVGFPLLFETKPRPMPVDVPIDLVRKDSTAPRPARVQPPPAVVDLPADAGNETPAVPAPVPSSVTSGKAAEPASKPAVASAPAPSIQASAPVPRPPAPALRNEEPARQDKPVAEARPAATPASAEAPAAGRFVVQVGAYTDQGALREARQKVEKLGLKTYTQDVDTPSGKRTRLRVGPFATRDQAESAGARLKAIGLPGNLLVL